MADPLPPNQLVSASQIISQLAPVFAGSGTTTSNATVTGGGGSTEDLENIINTAMANANNAQGQNSNVIQNIMTQAAQAFAPVVGQQSSSGMYNSNVLSMLSAMAQGQAVNQSAKTVLDFQTSQEELAANAAGKLASTNSTTSGTKATGPSINPGQALLTLGGGVVANKIGKSVLDSPAINDAASNAKNSVLSALGLGPKQSAGAATENMNHISNEIDFQNSASAQQPIVVQGADNAAVDGSVNTAFDGTGGGASLGDASIGAGTGTLAADSSGSVNLGDASGLLDASSVGSTASTTSELAALGGADAGAAIGGDVGEGVFLGDSVAGADTVGGALGLGITDSAAGIGDAAGLAVGLGPSVGVGDALAGGDVLGAVSAGEGSIEGAGAADAIGDVGAAAWIICTELARQKRMPLRFYSYGAKAFANYWNWGKCGYYIWAIPCVRHLRVKPNSKFSKFLELIFNWRAEYIAAYSGCRGARKLLRGRIVSYTLWAICFVLAVSICQFMKDPDWQALGKETA